MNVLKLKTIIFVLRLLCLDVLPVLSIEQCDCSIMSLIKQLVQQEMFERKLEDHSIRAELRRNSQKGITTTTDTADSDVETRLEALEQQLAEYERKVHTTHVSIEEQQDNDQTRMDETEDKSFFNVLMKKALQREKMERVNLVSDLQEKIVDFNYTFAEFETKTEIMIKEHWQKQSLKYEEFEQRLSQQLEEFRNETTLSLIENVEKTNEMASHRNDTDQFVQNISRKLDNFEVQLNNEMSAYGQQINLNIANFDNNVSNIDDEVKECVEEIDALKRTIREIEVGIESNKKDLSEIRDKHEEYNTQVDGRISHITKHLPDCPEEWERRENNCYFFSKDAKLWSESHKACKSLKSYLAEIGDEEENNFITQTVKRINEPFWIGLSDRHSEGSWQWDTSGVARFTKWNQGEPNNANRNEDCAMILNIPNGAWNDGQCNTHLRYICEKKTAVS